jgi:hypothetical protein
MNPLLDDYIDYDVAYLIGQIVARGTISEVGRVKTITIQFPFKNLEVEGLKKKFDQQQELVAGLQPAIKRITELTETDVRQEKSEKSVTLILESLKNTMFWRNIRLLTMKKSSYYEFEIPSQIFAIDDNNVKKEFLRGFADVAASARKSNADQQGKHRIYLDILNANWRLPVQLCHLLQDHLKIPVQTINYGHPNLRDSNLVEYRKGKKYVWAREHQLKVYCEDFHKIGFYIPYKQQILKELAEYNKKKFDRTKPCSPPKDTKPKPKHPEEKSPRLPLQLRNKHYSRYWEICRDLGCPRQNKCLPMFRPYMKSIQTSLIEPEITQLDED